MAKCNARYQFTKGNSGRQSAGSVYANSNLGYEIKNKQLKLPGEMMKPYASQNHPINQLIFNYQLSRTGRIIENVFGICTRRLFVLKWPIIASPKK